MNKLNMARFRTVHASGNLDQEFATKLGAANRWNDSGYAYTVEELIFGVWEEVPACELVHALRVARMRRAGIEPQLPAHTCNAACTEGR